VEDPWADERLLDVWVIFDHPRDQPDFYVVRRQRATRDGTILHDHRIYGFRELEKARAWLIQQGLTRLNRSLEDDPVILEIWI
jgi:hypothetical protein